MDQKPLVSFLCLSYNHEKYISQALKSIIAQDYENLEIIFWDNNSIDNSFEIGNDLLKKSGREFKAFNSPENLGVPKVLNNFLEESSGEYISLLALDDWITPDCISKKVTLYLKNPNVGIIYSDGYRFIDDKNEYIPIESPFPNKEFLFDELLKKNFLHTKGMLVKKSVFNKVGVFDESIQIEDWDMSLRIADKYPILHIAEKQFFYRMHSSNFSSQPKSDYFIAIFDTLYKHKEHSNYLIGIDRFMPGYIASLKKKGSFNAIAIKRIVKYSGIRKQTFNYILNRYRLYQQLNYYIKRIGTLIKQ
jgi:glycosyltransferase involved in cell wall biosynthesis